MKLRIVSAVAAALATLSLAAPTANAAQSESSAFAKIYLTMIVSQWTHWSPDSKPSSHAGTLRAGKSYFHCRTKGELFHDNARESDWWLRTDDDTGHRNVYVSDVFLDEESWSRDSSLPWC
ncbi:hypothetical protein [Amycolatopsis rubida]|uniref:Uncharacterized protein n=1 Tax=Amycolatopsis rubida TaxID=112413 RepID=A0A1I6AHP8_9PSEU|nr:hypothetical protein [Amycolatopsis rubida]SFQ68284.1 hypothetical protein SAMN05421854_11929 [Amycolatopsis rubida]